MSDAPCIQDNLKCILEGCETFQFCRGLCVKHYNQASRSISKGTETWQRLEELGLALPKKPRVFKRFSV